VRTGGMGKGIMGHHARIGAFDPSQ
jgi:hypothetical protein